MTLVSERDVYEVAYLCGGAERVALAAVAIMQHDGRIKISGERRVAVLGTAGIADAGFRDMFETPDPPPDGKLIPRAGKSAASHTYADVPPDTSMPMHPGISDRW